MHSQVKRQMVTQRDEIKRKIKLDLVAKRKAQERKRIDEKREGARADAAELREVKPPRHRRETATRPCHRRLTAAATPLNRREAAARVAHPGARSPSGHPVTAA